MTSSRDDLTAALAAYDAADRHENYAGVVVAAARALLAEDPPDRPVEGDAVRCSHGHIGQVVTVHDWKVGVNCMVDGEVEFSWWPDVDLTILRPGDPPDRPPTAGEVLAHMDEERAIERWDPWTQRWQVLAWSDVSQVRTRPEALIAYERRLKRVDPATPQPGLRLVPGEPEPTDATKETP